MTELEATTVRDNPAELRYELLLDGRRIGAIRYRVEADAVAVDEVAFRLDGISGMTRIRPSPLLR